MKSILFLFGTRPEAIKLAPLIKAFKAIPNMDVKVGVTAQHREMLDQVLAFFDIIPDYDLNIMKPNQTLHQLTADLITEVTTKILQDKTWHLIFVQGDTTTVLASALAGFYKKIPVAHIEAGLRSHDIYSPFPEEMNRLLTSRIAHYHFCPTPKSAKHLYAEGITKNVFTVGNTVIDALIKGVGIVKNMNQNLFLQHFNMVDFSKKIILVTCHRRENFGDPFKAICEALSAIAEKYPNAVEIVFPVHLNPNISQFANLYLTQKNIHLLSPLDYKNLLWILDKSYLVITDSGGIQEEAPSLGKPVIVLREVTERMEGVDAGNAILVGANKNKIISETEALLTDETHYARIASIQNPYGDGKSCLQIVTHLLPFLN
jgi:UDP-N-acetylglucosamine 2-epimerase (non-hydrolysing)